jgi:F-type H+-transporting ATPase subunit epsilon
MTHNGTLRLQVLLPTRVLVDTPIRKIIAEAENGSFCLLPRHIDFATALAPGILVFETEAGEEQLVANDRGILVKAGDDVRVSTFNAVRGDRLEVLRETVEEHFKKLDEHERVTRMALARLEAGTLRRFQNLENTRRGLE